jgi:hypothetical protein
VPWGHVIGHPSPELDQVGPIVNRPADFGRKSMGGQSTESVADHLRTDKSALIGGWEVRLVPAHPQAGKTDEGACGSRSARSQVGRFCERVEKRFCRFEVGRIEPFGKPVVDRLEECRRIGGSTLIAK